VGSVQVGRRKGCGAYCMREARLTVASSFLLIVIVMRDHNTTTTLSIQYVAATPPRPSPTQLSIVVILLDGP
jgi:hypothetical protein